MADQQEPRPTALSRATTDLYIPVVIKHGQATLHTHMGYQQNIEELIADINSKVKPAAKPEELYVARKGGKSVCLASKDKAVSLDELKDQLQMEFLEVEIKRK